MTIHPCHSLTVALIAAVASTAIAGDLNPPPGSLTETMKPLDEVEPRTPVNATNTPGDVNADFAISASGSYFLTGNLTGSDVSVDVIRIDAGDVTLDLRGFTISGGQFGALVVGSNAEVFGGVVSGTSGVYVTGDDATLRDLRVIDTTGSGISIVGGGGVVADCTVSGSSGRGISAPDDTLVQRSTARANGEIGIFASQVLDCRAVGNGQFGIATGNSAAPNEPGLVARCHAEGNSLAGITIYDEARVADCVAFGNSGYGIQGNRGAFISGCVAQNNTNDGINVAGRCTIVGNEVLDNDSFGIVATTFCRIADNNVTSNGAGGIQAASNATIIGNSVSDNGATIVGGPGIEVTGDGGRIDGNTLMSNDGAGIDFSGGQSGNLITRNTLYDDTITELLGNTTGSVSASPSTAGPWDNLSH